MPLQTHMLTTGHRLALALLVSSTWLCNSHAVRAYTPKSPMVKQMIDEGLKQLEGAGDGNREGAVCLQGLAFVKAERPASHPKIQKAIAAAKKRAAAVSKGHGSEGYAEAVACIFLCELDPDQYSREIAALHNDVLKLQIGNGAWAYRNTGSRDSDTSLTQYGMLALWTANSYGVDAPLGPVAQGARWLMQSQRQDGGFCYKPLAPPGNVATSQSTLSCTTAGGGSLYMAAYLLGFRAKAAEKKDDGLPPALERVEKSKSEALTQAQGIDASALLRACAAADTWVSRNFSTQNQNPQWTYYYLYGLERHMAFRELVLGKPEAEPNWYNSGVNYLKSKQLKSGGWKGSLGIEIDTSFAVLFLLRSTQKSIRKAVLNEGVLRGGHGLPKDIKNVSMKDGQVVTPQMIREVDEWLEILEGAEDIEFDPDALSGLPLDQDLTERTSQLERLRKLVSNEDYRARRVAVKTLATARDLDNVPILIYALTDKDPEVPIYARDGLRFISRKFKGFGMPDLVTKNGKVIAPTEDQKRAAAEKWKKWYLSIRPDGELLE